MSHNQRVMIVVTVPPEHVEPVLDAISGAGGGVVGQYTHCAFTVAGTGRFKPDADANPHTGSVGQINSEAEVRIETFCERDRARAVVAAIRAAHPYEEPVYYVLSLISDADL